MKLELAYPDKHKSYISEYLTAIRSIKFHNDDKYDIITHKNSKYHFHQFNDCLYRNEQFIERVRRTRTSEDEFDLLELQREKCVVLYRENTCNQ